MPTPRLPRAETTNPDRTDDPRPEARPAARIPAAARLASALLFVAAVALLPRGAWRAYAAAAAVLAIASAGARVRWRPVARRILLLEPFVLGIALLSLFQEHGLLVFLSMITKSTICIAGMVVLAATTPFAEMLSAMRRLGLPSLLVTTLALAYRYLFVLIEEATRLRRARASRTYASSRHIFWRDAAGVIAVLFVRSSERAERIYAAMCARGWKG